MKKLWHPDMFSQLVEDKYRYYLQMQLACVILGMAGVLMGIMNIFASRWNMVVATLSFSLVCMGNLVLLRKWRHMSWVNCILFEVSVVVLCGYFLVTGGADGFSPYWVIILPFCVMPLLGRKRGSYIMLAMLAMIVFLFWLPVGKGLLLYSYSKVFLARFPVVFIVSCLFGFGFEMSRYMVMKQMFANQAKVQLLSETDRLTGLKNRHWFQEQLEKITPEEKQKNKCAAFLLMDLDGFKIINDTYGHKTGDMVLVETAKLLKNTLHAEDLLCRWGGEEFLAYLPSCTLQEAEQAGQMLCDQVRTIDVKSAEGEAVPVSISVGVLVVPFHVEIENSDAFIEVDKQLYTAKRNGKNCISVKMLG